METLHAAGVFLKRTYAYLHTVAIAYQQKIIIIRLYF